MKLITYNTDYKLQLQQLVIDYFNEVHEGEVTGDLSDAGDMIDCAINEGKAIYLVIDKEQVVAYLIVYIQTQYNLTPAIVMCDYMYVTPSHRSTYAIVYLYGMVGKVCNDYQLDAIGSTFANSSNMKNNKIIEGKVIATTYRFKLEEQQAFSSRFIKRMEASNK